MSDELDLNELFPNLANYFDGGSNSGGSSVPAEHGGVTDEQVQAYFQQRMGRTLNPVNSSANPNVPLQFRSGTTAPAPTPGWDGPPPARSQQDVPATGPNENAPPSTPAELPHPFQEGENEDSPPDDSQGNSPQGAAPTGTDTSPPAVIDLGDGRQISRELVDAYEQFNARLAQDPELQALITDYLSGSVRRPVPENEGGGAVGPPAGSAVLPPSPYDTPPPDLDLSDPVIATMWNANKTAWEQQQAFLRQQQEAISQLTGVVQQQYNEQAERARRDNEAVIAMAAQSFAKDHALSDDEVKQLRMIAGRMNILPTLMSGVDPITGAPSTPDPAKAVQRALEIAYFSNPEYRAKEFARQQDQAKEGQRRKAKASSLSGSSGSSPRSTPAPTTPESKRAAMVAEVAAMLNGSWSGQDN